MLEYVYVVKKENGSLKALRRTGMDHFLFEVNFLAETLDFEVVACFSVPLKLLKPTFDLCKEFANNDISEKKLENEVEKIMNSSFSL